jgi:uncharacterized protein
VDLNTASAPLLSRVSGLSAVAASIVRWRDAHGAFRNRQQLLDVTGLGPRTFEQAAGFLRIRDGDNPLDQTGVHPETYPVVQKMLAATGRAGGRADGAQRRAAHAEARGLCRRALRCHHREGHPGRAGQARPRPAPGLQGGALQRRRVKDLKDLQPGMVLEGTVSNVAQFGAFVDLGVHQDGLVHVSQLSNKFVSDAREVVKTGQIVKVRVLEVDLARKRISLTMKLDDLISSLTSSTSLGRFSRVWSPTWASMFQM